MPSQRRPRRPGGHPPRAARPGPHRRSRATGTTGGRASGRPETGSPEVGSPEVGSPEVGSPEVGQPETEPTVATPADNGDGNGDATGEVRRRAEQPTQSGDGPRTLRRIAAIRAGGDRPRLTTRAAVLGLVVCALVLTLAYPIKDYLAQRSQSSALTQDNAARTAAIRALQARDRELHDPAYIKAQARKRLQYVMPGDTVFVVVRKGQQPATDLVAPAPRRPASGTWYDQLVGSFRRADAGG